MKSDTRADPWWEAPDDKAHELLFTLLDLLQGYDSSRRRDILTGMALYGDREAVKAISKIYEIASKGEVSYNLVKSCCDTAQSNIASQSTLSRILTSRGDWSLRRRAKLCERMIEGDYDRNSVHQQASEGFLDALKTGLTGFKVYTQAGRTKIDRVRPGEVFVDPVDGKYGDPRCIYQVSFLPRETVLGMVPTGKEGDKLRRAVENAPKANGSTLFPWEVHDTSMDTVKVVEAWRTPDPEESSSDDAGRHVICIQGATLLDEEWDRGLPFVWYRYDPESTGFYGQGMAMNLLGIQREINFTYRKTQRCLDLNSGFQVFLDDASDLEEDDITELPGQIHRYRGGTNPPVIRSSNVVPSEFWHYIGELIQRGYEQEGLSQLGATSKKPAGLNSGEAIREYNDIEASRFAIKARAFEKFIGIDLAKKVIEEKTHQADEERPVQAKMPRGRGVKFLNIRWSDVALDPDDYTMKVTSSSELPRTSAGRQATIDGWLAGGFVGREQYLMLTQRPDLDDFLAMELAPYEVVLDHLEDMIEDGVYTPPETVQDIQLSLRLASNAFQRHTADGAPEENTELILTYIEDLRHMQAEAAKAAAAQGAGPQGVEAPPQQLPGAAA